MNINEIIERINSVDGLAASIETEATDATQNHIGLVCVTLDSSAPEFHEAIKHAPVADIIELEFAKLSITDQLLCVDSDDAASVAWFKYY